MTNIFQHHYFSRLEKCNVKRSIKKVKKVNNIIIGTYKVGNKDFEDDIGIDGKTFDSANVFLKSV